MIKRKNTRFGKNSCILVAGDFFATRDDMCIETVLGSCISVCLLDEKNKIAGMNHFMLPTNRNPGMHEQTKVGRYGVNAMELLINKMMRLGADRYSMKAKVFGGGNVTQSRTGILRIGDWNTDFALKFLETEEIPIISKDVGGHGGRRIVLFTRNGSVKLRRLAGSETASVARNEMQYRTRVSRTMPVEKKEQGQGKVTLFDDDLTLF